MNSAPAPCPTTAERLPTLAEAISAALQGDVAPAALLAHRAAVLHLATELQRTPEEVAALYCAEMARCCRLASVDDYLPVLIAKKVRQQLRTGATGAPT